VLIGHVLENNESVIIRMYSVFHLSLLLKECKGSINIVFHKHKITA